jgi:hypothetical protein
MKLVNKFLCYGQKPLEERSAEVIKNATEVRYWVFLTDIDDVVLQEGSLMAECRDKGLLLTHKINKPARYKGATMIYDFASAQFIFVEDFKDEGVVNGCSFGGNTYEVAKESERVKDAEETLRASLPFILNHSDLIICVGCVEFLRDSIYRLCKIKINHQDGDTYIIPISNLPLLPSNGLTFDFYNYMYSETFTGGIVDCGEGEFTVKVSGELFTLKTKDFNQVGNVEIVRELSPDENIESVIVSGAILNDDPISKLKALASI